MVRSKYASSALVGAVLDTYTDAAVARFCSANDWDVARASRAIRRTAAWRRTSMADTYRAAFLAGRRLLDYDVARAWMRALDISPCLGTTTAGDVVTYAVVGSLDPVTVCSALSLKDYFEANLILLEWQCLAIDRATFERADGTSSRIHFVFDVDGLSLDRT